VLFPVRIDELVLTTPEPWARKLRDQRHIGDFRQWEKCRGIFKKPRKALARPESDHEQLRTGVEGPVFPPVARGPVLIVSQRAGGSRRSRCKNSALLIVPFQ